MIWLIYCAFFLLMLFNIVRMLRQRGKWAWVLFLGLITSVVAYVVLFIVPVASATALQSNRVLLGLILVGGTLFYAGGMIYFIRRMAAKMKADPNSPP
jgi:hypothetical protein